MRLATVAALCLAMSPGLAHRAEAARSDARGEIRSASAPQRVAFAARPAAPRHTTGIGSLSGEQRSGGGISCVPYARAVTGMAISGNGRDWWYNAAGRYARSQRPAEGAVLSFPGTGRMPMGHVAVVSRVVHPRMVEIDHANWGGPGIRRGMVMRNVRVLDVSPDNSWTRVRVQVGWDRDTFGSEYPTHGFIHNRGDGFYAGGDDNLRPVAYSTRRSVEAPRTQAPRPQARRAAEARGPRAQPIRVAQARR